MAVGKPVMGPRGSFSDALPPLSHVPLLLFAFFSVSLLFYLKWARSTCRHQSLPGGWTPLAPSAPYTAPDLTPLEAEAIRLEPSPLETPGSNH